MLELIVGGILIWLGVTLLKNKNGGFHPQEMVQNIHNQYNFYCDPTYARDVERLLREDYLDDVVKRLPQPEEHITCEKIESNIVEEKEVEQVEEREVEQSSNYNIGSTIKFKNNNFPPIPKSIKLGKRKDYFEETLILDEDEDEKKKVVVVDDDDYQVYSDTRTAPLGNVVDEIIAKGVA